MRRSTLLILANVTAVALLAALFAPSPEMTSGTAVPQMADFKKVNAAVRAATKLVVTLRDTSTILDKKDDAWFLGNKADYPVPDATIQPILSALADLHGMAPKTTLTKLYPRLELADPGPDSPARRVELFDAKGTSLAVLIVGKPRDESNFGGHNGSYARIPGNPQSWLAEPALSFPTQPLDWIDRVIVRVDPARIAQATITPAGGKPLIISRQKPDDGFAIEGQPKPTKKDPDDPGLATAQSFQSIELDDVRPAAELAGITATTVTRAETFDGLAVELQQRQKDGENWVIVHAEGQGKTADEAAEINKRTNAWAYRFAGVKAAGNVGTTLNDLKAPPK